MFSWEILTGVVEREFFSDWKLKSGDQICQDTQRFVRAFLSIRTNVRSAQLSERVTQEGKNEKNWHKTFLETPENGSNDKRG